MTNDVRWPVPLQVYQERLSKHLDDFLANENNGDILTSENRPHRVVALIEMVKRAKNQIYIYTDSPDNFLDDKLARALEDAHNRGVKLNIAIRGDKDPADAIYSNQDAWKWPLLKKVARVYKILPDDGNSLHEIVVADRMSRIEFVYPKEKKVWPRRMGYILTQQEAVTWAMSNVPTVLVRENILKAKPQIKGNDNCHTIGA